MYMKHYGVICIDVNIPLPHNCDYNMRKKTVEPVGSSGKVGFLCCSNSDLSLDTSHVHNNRSAAAHLHLRAEPCWRFAR